MSHRFTFEAIGTGWVIDLYAAPERIEIHVIEAAVHARIAAFDHVYSRFRNDSLIAEMAHVPGTYTLPDDAQPLFNLYGELYHLSGGAFTPLVGQLLSDAGYDSHYSLTPAPTLHPSLSWDEVMTYAYPTLTMHKPALLDVGAAGKGYLVDLVAEVLREQGITRFCIDAGGDILHTNTEKIRIALEDPADATRAIGVVELAGASLCGSSGSRRQWAGLHHIFDPHSAAPVRDILATWVIADSALLADAMTTCLFLVPPSELSARYTFEYLVLSADRTVHSSEGFAAELFLEQPK